MNKIYHKETAIRRTKAGSTCWHYHWFETFGRDAAYAHSWGNREQRGTGMIWSKPGESFDEAIARRATENAAV